MNKTIFFQTSMPRAGSTLLQNIIGQNPNFHVTPTSGVVDLIEGLSISFYKSLNFKKEKNYDLCKESFYSFCKEGINGYYSNINKSYILDKNRDWLSHIHTLNKLYHKPKILFLVRDLRSIFTSHEKQYIKDIVHRKNIERFYKLSPNNTLSERIKVYEEGPLKYVLRSLVEIVNYKNPNNIHLIRFEDLCINPQQTLNKIYSYLEIPTFKHNFNQVNQITYENDNFHFFGDHSIKPQVTLPPKDWDKYIAPKILNDIYKENEWFFQTFNYPK